MSTSTAVPVRSGEVASHSGEHADWKLSRELSVLYLGFNRGTSLHRAHALRRLGHEVTILDPRTLVSEGRVADYLIYHFGGSLFEGFIRRQILKRLPKHGFDLVWIDGGELIGSALVRELKKRYGPTVNYNHDDPFGKRDGKKYKLYLEALPVYDVVAVFRDVNVSEAKAFGAKKVLRFFMSADEVAHSPRQISDSDREKWSSEVIFLGTWMPERGPFLLRLVELGVPLTIYGDHWQKATEWPSLKSYWKGPGLTSEDDYAMAVQCAKVCLGLLSKGNRDLSTTRSFEIPLLGGVLCAERTSEHLTLYREGVDALFWETAEECASQCRRLLDDEALRFKLATNARDRVLRNGGTHESALKTILSEALSLQESLRDSSNEICN